MTVFLNTALKLRNKRSRLTKRFHNFTLQCCLRDSDAFLMNHWINCQEWWNTSHELLVVFRHIVIAAGLGQKQCGSGTGTKGAAERVWVRSRDRLIYRPGQYLGFTDISVSAKTKRLILSTSVGVDTMLLYSSRMQIAHASKHNEPS